MEPASKVLGGTILDAFDSVDSDQGPNRMHLLNQKSWHGADFRIISFHIWIRFRGPGGAWWSLNLKSWGTILDAFDSVDSDQGPNPIRLLQRKWPPRL